VADTNWEEVARECLAALKLFNKHYDDLGKSNPGFMATSTVLKKYAHLTK
jgi:hypothetical protein